MGGHTVERLQAEGLAIGPTGAAANTQVAAAAQSKATTVPAGSAKTNTAVTVKK
jgi:competence protein ComEA